MYYLIHFTLGKNWRKIIEFFKSNKLRRKWENAYMYVLLSFSFIENFILFWFFFTSILYIICYIFPLW
jgi:hypothetical protein